MEPQILTEQQERSIRGQLIEAGYPNPEKILKTAHAVYSGLDRVEHDGISFFDGEPKDNLFSILLFVDKGKGDYRHYSTRASWQWPSPILSLGINMVVEEYHAANGGIPTVHRIKDLLMIQVDQQNKADEAILNEPLKSALECLGIPGSTRLVSSGAWEEGVLFLEAVRDMRVLGTEAAIRLRLEIITIFSSKDGSPARIAQVSVTPDPSIQLFAANGSEPLDKLRYHYRHGPIPDIGKIEQDVQTIFATQQQEVSQDSLKVRQVPQNQPPPGPSIKRPYRPRH